MRRNMHIWRVIIKKLVLFILAIPTWYFFEFLLASRESCSPTWPAVLISASVQCRIANGSKWPNTLSNLPRIRNTGNSLIHFPHSHTDQRGESVCEMKRWLSVFKTPVCTNHNRSWYGYGCRGEVPPASAPHSVSRCWSNLRCSFRVILL